MKVFEEIYNSIPREKLNQLDKLRKKDCSIKKLEILLVVFFILASIVNFYIGKMVFLVEVIIIYVTYRISRIYFYTSFEKDYKKEIIKPIVESYNDDIIFNPDGEITKEEYSETGYRMGNEYYVGDYFETKDKSLRSCEVSVIDDYEDNDGENHHMVLFSGIFSIITLNNFSEETISVSLDSKIRNFFMNNKVEVDSSEFEKNFDLYCENRIYAMEIFTAEVLNLLSELFKKSDVKYDLLIKQNKLYVRYYKKDIFDISLKDSMEEEYIKEIYENSYKVLELLTTLQKCIDEKLGYLKGN